jgi:hypothetical protein
MPIAIASEALTSKTLLSDNIKDGPGLMSAERAGRSARFEANRQGKGGMPDGGGAAKDEGQWSAQDSCYARCAVKGTVIGTVRTLAAGVGVIKNIGNENPDGAEAAVERFDKELKKARLGEYQDKCIEKECKQPGTNSGTKPNDDKDTKDKDKDAKEKKEKKDKEIPVPLTKAPNQPKGDGGTKGGTVGKNAMTAEGMQVDPQGAPGEKPRRCSSPTEEGCTCGITERGETGFGRCAQDPRGGLASTPWAIKNVEFGKQPEVYARGGRRQSDGAPDVTPWQYPGGVGVPYEKPGVPVGKEGQREQPRPPSPDRVDQPGTPPPGARSVPSGVPR